MHDIQRYGNNGYGGPDDTEYPDVYFVVTHTHTFANEKEKVHTERKHLVSLVVRQIGVRLQVAVEGIPVLDTHLFADETKHKHGD